MPTKNCHALKKILTAKPAFCIYPLSRGKQACAVDLFSRCLREAPQAVSHHIRMTGGHGGSREPARGESSSLHLLGKRGWRKISIVPVRRVGQFPYNRRRSLRRWHRRKRSRAMGRSQVLRGRGLVLCAARSPAVIRRPVHSPVPASLPEQPILYCTNRTQPAAWRLHRSHHAPRDAASRGA